MRRLMPLSCLNINIVHISQTQETVDWKYQQEQSLTNNNYQHCVSQT